MQLRTVVKVQIYLSSFEYESKLQADVPLVISAHNIEYYVM